MKTLLITTLLAAVGPVLCADVGPGRDVIFAASADTVACHDFIEVTVRVDTPPRADPDSDPGLEGTFGIAGQPPLTVKGFRDAEDGSVFRIRFMPSSPGNYDYVVRWHAGDVVRTGPGSFTAVEDRRKGVLRVDPAHPAHLLWDASQERFYWSGLEATGLVGLDRDTLAASLDLLDRCRVTALRVALADRCDSTFWTHAEQLLTFARVRNMAVAVVLPADPTDPEVRHTIRTAIVRLAAFSNVVWEWSEPDPELQPMLGADPYRHVVWTRQPSLSLATEASRLPAGSTPMRVAWERAIRGGYSTLHASSGMSPDAHEALARELEPIGHLYDFFTGFPWWELQTDSTLIAALHPFSSQASVPQAFAARNADGDLAAVYVAGGGIVTVRDEMLRDQLKPVWFSPRDGGIRNARALRARVYRTPTAEDWVLLFRTPCNCSFRDFDNEFE